MLFRLLTMSAFALTIDPYDGTFTIPPPGDPDACSRVFTITDSTRAPLRGVELVCDNADVYPSYGPILDLHAVAYRRKVSACYGSTAQPAERIPCTLYDAAGTELGYVEINLVTEF